jgi:hypothetical protein
MQDADPIDHATNHVGRRFPNRVERLGTSLSSLCQTTDQRITKSLMLAADYVDWQNAVRDVSKVNQLKELLKLVLFIEREGAAVQKEDPQRLPPRPLASNRERCSGKKSLHGLQVLSEAERRRESELDGDTNLASLFLREAWPMVIGREVQGSTPARTAR